MQIIRTLVAGPKRRYVGEGYSLDLTYITPRLIAMAFPSTGMEQVYRNPIAEVSAFLQQRHPGSHLIVNASNRAYDYSLFHKVIELEWEDHRAPVLGDLLEAVSIALKFLEQDEKNVVVANCNHGKGRTGTFLISLLLMTGLYSSPEQALRFYNQRRFEQNALGVCQPCQLRYLGYVGRVSREGKLPVPRTAILFSATFVKVDCLSIAARLIKVRQKAQVSQLIEKSQSAPGQVGLVPLNYIKLAGDYMLLVQFGCFWATQARISFNVSMIQDDELVLSPAEVSPESLRKTGLFGQDSKVVLEFERCFCQTEAERCESCRAQLEEEGRAYEAGSESLLQARESGSRVRLG